MSSIKIYENKTKRRGGTHIWICGYDGTLSTAFGLSSWLFTEGEKHGEMYIGFDSKKKK